MSNPFPEPAQVFMYTLELLHPAIKTAGPTPAEAASVGRQWAHLQDLAANEQLLFAGRTLSIEDAGFASVVFPADSKEEGRAVMDRDPGIREGLLRGHLYHYQVLLMGEWLPSETSDTPAELTRQTRCTTLDLGTLDIRGWHFDSCRSGGRTVRDTLSPPTQSSPEPYWRVCTCRKPWMAVNIRGLE